MMDVIWSPEPTLSISSSTYLTSRVDGVNFTLSSADRVGDLEHSLIDLAI